MSRRALVALALVISAVTGVAFATPVPVLSVSDGRREFLGVLLDRGRLLHSYRQSIYEVTVFEEFRRVGDRLDFVRVITSDVRAIEYLRWDTPIREENDQFVADAPPADLGELVIRVSPGAEQRLYTDDWSVFLADRFGDTVVRVRLERPGVLPALLRGLTW